MAGDHTKEVLNFLTATGLHEQMEMVPLDGILVNFDIEFVRVFFDEPQDHLFVTEQGSSADGMLRFHRDVVALLKVQRPSRSSFHDGKASAVFPSRFEFLEEFELFYLRF